MKVEYQRVIKHASELRPNKQHLVVFEMNSDAYRIAESLNNCYVVHAQMTTADWHNMIHDFEHGVIKTILVRKMVVNHGWKLNMSPDDVDIHFTFEPTKSEILRANARLKFFKFS